MKRPLLETIIDVALFLFITFPLSFSLLTSSICSGWNPGSLQGECLIPFVTPIYNTVAGISYFLSLLLLLAGRYYFTIAAVVSLVIKISRYTSYIRGNVPKKIGLLAIELITLVPILLLLSAFIWNMVVSI